ncbi:hypothetical protein GCM10009661_81920 [Catellatospora chokoriensis]
MLAELEVLRPAEHPMPVLDVRLAEDLVGHLHVPGRELARAYAHRNTLSHLTRPWCGGPSEVFGADRLTRKRESGEPGVGQSAGQEDPSRVHDRVTPRARPAGRR